jgi:short-subunit dehydrogenase
MVVSLVHRARTSGIPAPGAGSVALVTGASSGVGRELARLLCERGHDIVVVARRRERLEELADELRERFVGRRVEVVPCDLSDPLARESLVDHVNALGLNVETLALAAGFGIGGPFTAHDPERTQLMVRTNLEGVIALTGAFAPGMERRRSGAILIVSSITGNQPMPNMAAYAATKAAVTSFAESLHEELRSSEIAVTVLCPGPINTEFVDVAAMGHTAHRTRFFFSEPKDVAGAGIHALEQRRRTVVPGIAARVLHAVGGHAPRLLWLPLCRRLMA